MVIDFPSFILILYNYTPRILSATVRDNILFSHEYDEVFYDLVIEGLLIICAIINELQVINLGCALGPDLALLPQGDMTEVGEKGEQICCSL